LTFVRSFVFHLKDVDIPATLAKALPETLPLFGAHARHFLLHFLPKSRSPGPVVASMASSHIPIAGQQPGKKHEAQRLQVGDAGAAKEIGNQAIPDEGQEKSPDQKSSHPPAHMGPHMMAVGVGAMTTVLLVVAVVAVMMMRMFAHGNQVKSDRRRPQRLS